MADVRPFRALRYSADVDIAAAISPPYDVISTQQQRQLHERSPHNAVHIELAEENGGDRYQKAAAALARWRAEGALARDDRLSYYLHRQTFEHGGQAYTRTILFARLRLEPWDRGIVLPHEQTFGGPKADRLQLLRATRLNTSPVFLVYRDPQSHVQQILEASPGALVADFVDSDGQHHQLRKIDDPATTGRLHEAFAPQSLYVADGHHRYETALGYRDQCRAAAPAWTGEEPENFALAALASHADPGLLVLPIHRVTAAGAPLAEAGERLRALFTLETSDASPEGLPGLLAHRGKGNFALIANESPQPFLLSLRDREAIDRLLPQDRSPAWRALDYAIANYAIMRHALSLADNDMSDYSRVWFTEDALEAAENVRGGRARYAVLLNPVPVDEVIALADAGERMPQKSTFFYPKVPTGLVFNPLDP